MKKSENVKSDLDALAAMTDDDIDCSDLPAFTQEELDAAEGFAEGPDRETILLSFDRSVLEYFRGQGRDYRERMNSVLRDYALANA